MNILHDIYKFLKPYRRLLNILTIQAEVRVRRMRKKRIIFLLGIPEHNNIGDLAITRAEISFIRQHYGHMTCIPIPYRVISAGSNFLLKLVNDTDIIVGHGGGNLGDTYLYEEMTRRSIINNFPDNKIIIFPQTLYFSSTKSGVAELRKTQTTYSRHRHLTIIAREKVSYKKMCEYFPNNTILLTPDIVLSMSKTTLPHARKGALICFRSDIESALDQKSYAHIIDQITKEYKNVKITDTIEKGWLYKFKPNSVIVNRKLKQFINAEIVVTDRLHGMVFAAITGTPCIVFSNFNHKVRGVYDWIKDLGYIIYCNSIDDFNGVSTQALTSRASVYNPNKFSAYWKLIDNEILEDSDKK